MSAGAATSKDSVAALSTTTEIVAGKFSENDWHQLVVEEENEAFCSRILEEMLHDTMQHCYQKYIERQLLPFTVETAREALLEIVELRYLERDCGETEQLLDSCWAEDDEAEAVAFDSWAVGAVPCTVFGNEDTESLARTTGRSVKGEESAVDSGTNQMKDAEYPENEAQEEITNEAKTSEESAINTQTEKPEQGKPEKTEDNTGPPKKRKTKFKPKRGPIGSAGVSRMSETIFETELRLLQQTVQNENADATDRMTSSEMPAKMQQALKAQAGRPPGLGEAPVKDVNVVIVDSRAVVENIAPIQVKTNFSIVDPEVEAAQQRLVAMRTGKYNPIATGPSPPKPSKKASAKFDVSEPKKKQTQEFRNEQQLTYDRAASNGVAPVPPPLIESMDVVAGVTVREGGRVKQGPRRTQKQSTTYAQHLTESMLLPVNKLKSKNAISVNEIINPIQPAKNAKPLPPIA